MRKSLVLLTVLVLALTAIAAPALAGKKKKGSFSAQGIPYPEATEGCNGSMEGVNKVSEPLKAPFNGVLTVTMVDFVGDWDLFVNTADGNELGSATASQLTGDPPTEEVVLALRKGTQVLMAPCNWAGGPSATVNWEFVATK